MRRLAATDRRAAPPQPRPDQVNADRLVDVVDLVNWVYGDQRAHEVDGRGIGLHEGERATEIARRKNVPAVSVARIAADSSVRTAAQAELGCKVDKVGYDMGELHPVAEAVDSMVARLLAVDLIVRHAQKKEIPAGADFEIKLEPDWKDLPRYDMQACGPCCNHTVRMMPRHGTFKITYDRNKHPLFCPLIFDHEPEFLGQLRRDYMAWHDGLSMLVVYCCDYRDRLGGLVVTGPSLLRQPWLGKSAYKGVTGAVKSK